MGRFYSLVNFTKKESICVGKAGEEPVFQILKEMKKRFQWNLDIDKIELCDSENLWMIGYSSITDSDSEGDESSSSKENHKLREKFIERDADFRWSERTELWNNLKQ